jgi:hypothetical protein
MDAAPVFIKDWSMGGEGFCPGRNAGMHSRENTIGSRVTLLQAIRRLPSWIALCALSWFFCCKVCIDDLSFFSDMISKLVSLINIGNIHVPYIIVFVFGNSNSFFYFFLSIL